MDSATIQAYDLRAADFAARYAAADLAPLHRQLLAHLQPRCRVLEIGCGTGREAAFLAANGFAVTATDASEAMLDQARQVAGVGEIQGPGFRVQEEPAILIPILVPIFIPILVASLVDKAHDKARDKVIQRPASSPPSSRSPPATRCYPSALTPSWRCRWSCTSPMPTSLNLPSNSAPCSPPAAR